MVDNWLTYWNAKRCLKPKIAKRLQIQQNRNENHGTSTKHIHVKYQVTRCTESNIHEEYVLHYRANLGLTFGEITAFLLEFQVEGQRL